MTKILKSSNFSIPFPDERPYKKSDRIKDELLVKEYRQRSKLLRESKMIKLSENEEFVSDAVEMWRLDYLAVNRVEAIKSIIEMTETKIHKQYEELLKDKERLDFLEKELIEYGYTGFEFPLMYDAYDYDVNDNPINGKFVVEPLCSNGDYVKTDSLREILDLAIIESKKENE